MKEIHIFTVFETVEAFFDGQFNYLAERGEDIIIVSSFHPNAKDFAERNRIRFVAVDIPRAIDLKAILKAIFFIIKLIRHEKPDVVFGHTPVGALCAMLASKLCRVNNRVYYRHGLIYTTMNGIKRKIFIMEERFVAFLATSIINVSHSLSRIASRDKLNNNNKQYVIGHGTCGGIDAVNLFNPYLLDNDIILNKRKELCLDNATIIFGFVGRICNDKGIPELLDAFKIFQQNNTNIKAKLLLIGRFDTRDAIHNDYMQQIESNENIILVGSIEKKNIPYYYSLIDVFVFPSHREGFGMVVLEASAMQKPVLVSQVHGCEDSIIEHVTGEFIQLSSESIYLGMEMMLDTDKRYFYGKNGRQVVLERYDIQVMWPLVYNLYKQIIKI